MKRLLLLLDSDPMPNSYDIIVGYDGGADHVVSYGGITPDKVGCLIDGAVFTRGPSEKKHTAVFIGGAKEGAQVSLTSRDKQRATAACRLIQARFGVSPIPLAAVDNDARGATIRGADIVFAAGAIGVELLEERHWRDEGNIELIADCNAAPPLGVGGIDATDKGNTRQQKLAFGALGIGGLKLKLHRACIAQLFQSSDQVLDAEEIFALAKTMTR